ncbi:MAG: MFS transporter [Patescibacteria group bacterium]|nr:MFS transporter [Patescibacteria group bacterium]
MASAVISDTTDIKDRAKGFGIIGASFGFGFVFGPAISALTVGFGIAVPFIIAGVIALLSVFLTAFLLPETNKNIGKVKNAKIFDFKKLVTEILNKNLGMTFLISLIYSFAFGIYIFSFQPFAIKILNLSTNGISEIFTMFGVIGLISQGFILPRVIKKLNEKKLLIYSFFFITLSFFAVFFVKQVLYFVLVSIVLSFSNSFIGPLIQTILSKESDEKSQGTILGLNSSYISLGSIFGPVAGGFLAIFYIPLPFLLAGFTLFICMLLSIRVIHLERIKKESAF